MRRGTKVSAAAAVLATVAALTAGALTTAVPASAAAITSETFSAADGTFVSQNAFWSTADLGMKENPTWFAESGAMYRRGGTGTTDSAVFRMWTRHKDIASPTASLDVKFNGWAGGSEGWHGINLWLNKKMCTPWPTCGKVRDISGNDGYALDFLNRDGGLTILKKVSGDTRSKWRGAISYTQGGTYYTLKSTRWSPVSGQTYRFTGISRDNGNGTTTLRILINGAVKLEVLDNGSVAGPHLTGGRVGLRSDYAKMTVDNISVSSGATTVAPTPRPTATVVPTATGFEAETMTAPASTGIVASDSTASGGKYRYLWSNGFATKTVSTGSFSTVVVRARGQQCGGAPTMAVRVDGVTVATWAIPATSWTNYNIPVSRRAGSHRIEVGFINDTLTSWCDRNLLVDRVQVR